MLLLEFVADEDTKDDVLDVLSTTPWQDALDTIRPRRNRSVLGSMCICVPACLRTLHTYSCACMRGCSCMRVYMPSVALVISPQSIEHL